MFTVILWLLISQTLSPITTNSIQSPHTTNTITHPAKTNTATQKQQVETVFNLIRHSPSWVDIQYTGSREDAVKKKKIMESLRRISAYDTDIIESVVIKYCKLVNDDANKLPKVYLLTRYLFEVPQEIPIKDIFTKRCDFFVLGAPRTNEKLNSLWPLSWGKDGHLIITGTINIWPPVAPGQSFIDGFEYCKNHYKRRTKT